MHRLLGLALALCACNQFPGSCKDAVGRAQAAKAVTSDESPAVIATCTAEHWSTATKACIANAANHAQVVVCEDDVGTDEQRTLRRFTRFRDAMCTCKDEACAQAITDEMTRWSQDQVRKHPTPPPRMPEEQVKQFTELGESLAKCMQTAMSPKPAEPPTRSNDCPTCDQVTPSR